MINATASTETKLASALARVNIFIDAEFDKLAKDLDAMVPVYERKKTISEISYEMMMKQQRDILNGNDNAGMRMLQDAMLYGTGAIRTEHIPFGNLSNNPHINGQAAQQIPRDTLEMLGLR